MFENNEATKLAQQEIGERNDVTYCAVFHSREAATGKARLPMAEKKTGVSENTTGKARLPMVEKPGVGKQADAITM